MCLKADGALTQLCPTFDFGPGHDLRVVGSSPTSGSALSGESACNSLSPSTLHLPHPRALFLKQTNLKK